MDDRRFDSLVKALAEGRSRRALLKGMLGLGGAALVGGAAREPEVEAARRATPTPTPVRCPGKQTRVGNQCVCQVPPAPGPNTCGPDCCTGKATDPYPRLPGHSECCDNTCCFGTCYGEELCCPTNLRAGGLPPTHLFCDGQCLPVTGDGACCDDGDCGDPCQRCDAATRTCVARCDAQTEVCCTEQAGPGVCVTGACCLGVPSCGAGAICCQGAAGTICVTGNCCDNSDCPVIDACTENRCQLGSCVPVPVTCASGNPCFTDSCDPVRGCITTPVICDDNDVCTTDTCNPDVGCVYTAVSCDDDDPCTTDTCDPRFGCVHTAVDCSGLNNPALCLAGVCTDGICAAQSTCAVGTGCCGDGTCSAACACTGNEGACIATSECCAGCCIANFPTFDEWVEFCLAAGFIGNAADLCAQSILDGNYPSTCLDPPVVTYGELVVTLPCAD